jgi:hypothetical protein
MLTLANSVFGIVCFPKVYISVIPAIQFITSSVLSETLYLAVCGACNTYFWDIF